MGTPIGELTDRMRDIFGLVVDTYLERGIPVGSKALVERHGLGVSPASVAAAMLLHPLVSDAMQVAPARAPASAAFCAIAVPADPA